MNNELLDVLVPAYGNAGGVERILTLFAKEPRVRVLVSDDSPDPRVQQDIEQLCHRFGAVYKEGARIGAVANWNYLLTMASSTYCVLVHHDECFSDVKFINALEDRQNFVDAMILPVNVVNPKNISRKVASWQQAILMKLFLPFGPMLNIIGGPTACIILRTQKRCYFDPRLVYQVDCEWYSRLLSTITFKNLYFNNHTLVDSIYYPESITNNIKDNLKETIKADMDSLRESPWRGMVKRWGYVSHLIIGLYKFVLLPSFIPYYIKRFRAEKYVNR